TSWEDAWRHAARELDTADAGMITSFCPDAAAAEALMLESSVPVRGFYDLDTPITLDRLARGEEVPYIGRRGLADYDVVLSFTRRASPDARSSRPAAHAGVSSCRSA